MAGVDYTNITLPLAGHDVAGPVTLVLEIILVLGNILPIILVIVVKHGVDRLPTDELILALSMTDILSVVIPGPLGWISYFTHQWHGGKYTCQCYQVITMWFQLTSLCLITFMAFDRWMCMKDTSSNQTTRRVKNTHVRVSVLLIYIFTCLISCVPFTGLTPDITSPTNICKSWLLSHPRSSLEYVYHLVFFTVGYFNVLTTLVIDVALITNMRTFINVNGTTHTSRSGNSMNQRTSEHMTEYSLMILIVSIVATLIWTLSLTLLTLIQFHLPIPESLILYSLLSTTLTGLLNPAIYGLISHTYRSGYHKMALTTCEVCMCIPRGDDQSSKAHERPRQRVGAYSRSKQSLQSYDTQNTISTVHTPSSPISDYQDVFIEPTFEVHSQCVESPPTSGRAEPSCRHMAPPSVLAWREVDQSRLSLISEEHDNQDITVKTDEHIPNDDPDSVHQSSYHS